MKIKAISHKQFVEYVGTHDVPGKPNIEQVLLPWSPSPSLSTVTNPVVFSTPCPQVNFAREFEFRAEETTMEAAEREICRTLRLKDCQAW